MNKEDYIDKMNMHSLVYNLEQERVKVIHLMEYKRKRLVEIQDKNKDFRNDEEYQRLTEEYIFDIINLSPLVDFIMSHSSGAETFNNHVREYLKIPAKFKTLMEYINSNVNANQESN